MKCRNQNHKFIVRSVERKWTKKDGTLMVKVYKEDVCCTCRQKKEKEGNLFKINRNLSKLTRMTDLERELVRVLRLSVNNKCLPDIRKLNSTIESHIRRRELSYAN